MYSNAEQALQYCHVVAAAVRIAYLHTHCSSASIRSAAWSAVGSAASLFTSPTALPTATQHPNRYQTALSGTLLPEAFLGGVTRALGEEVTK